MAKSRRKSFGLYDKTCNASLVENMMERDRDSIGI